METLAIETATAAPSALLYIMVGFVIAFQVIDLVRKQTVTRRADEREKNIDALLQSIATQVNELHQWHDVTDNDGVKVWYIRHSMAKKIDEIEKHLTTVETLLKNGNGNGH